VLFRSPQNPKTPVICLSNSNKFIIQTMATGHPKSTTIFSSDPPKPAKKSADPEMTLSKSDGKG